MCYNCGCRLQNDPMGKSTVHGASLTEESFEEMAKEWKMTKEEAKKNVYEMLKGQIGQK